MKEVYQAERNMSNKLPVHFAKIYGANKGDKARKISWSHLMEVPGMLGWRVDI